VAFLSPSSVTLRLTRTQAERKSAMRIVLVQGIITALVAAACGLGLGQEAAISALRGGGIGMAATALMVLAVFRYPEGASATRIAWGFYLGQFLKVALSIALLIVAFGAPRAVPAAVLVAYVATFAGYWGAPRLPLSRR
jgi:ATP synthase protein I